MTPEQQAEKYATKEWSHDDKAWLGAEAGFRTGHSSRNAEVAELEEKLGVAVEFIEDLAKNGDCAGPDGLYGQLAREALSRIRGKNDSQ